MAFLNNQFFCLPEPIKMLQAARPLLQKETDFDPTLFEISLEDTTYLRIVCSLSSNDPSRPDREIMYIYTGLRTVNKLSCVSFMYRFTDDVNKELSLDIYFNDHFEIVFYRLFSFWTAHKFRYNPVLGLGVEPCALGMNPELFYNAHFELLHFSDYKY